MATLAQGGCMCAAVRYECKADATFMYNCHCRDCQRASGGPYAAAMGVPRSAVKITGELKYYGSIADSGNRLERGFCQNCGSLVMARPSASPDRAVIYAASLDDASIFKPAMDIYTSSAQPWDYMNPGLPKFPKMPPRG